MHHLEQAWLANWIKRPLLSSIHFCRKWLEKQLQETNDPEISSAMRRLLAQLEQSEKKAHLIHPFALNEWFDRVTRSLKQCAHWLDFLPAQQKRLNVTSHEEMLNLEPARSTNRFSEPRVPIGKHKLPPLPYPYNALEPYIDEQTMRLHHDEHHQSYVNGLNQAEKMMELARQSGNYELIKHWEREAAFNGAGHYLHTIFWETMSPHGGGEPSGPLLKQIEHDFGSFEAFKKHFSMAAEKVEGGGWAILVWSPRSHRLEILQAEKHQNLSQQDVIPLLPLDVWEHAYYLKYPNRRKDYIEAWWNVVFWPQVQHRFKVARQVIWHPY
jgi:Fe-Mn family superoxide dismutase